MTQLTCFLIEDNPLIRENLIAALHETTPVEVIGVAQDEEGALAWLQHPSAPVDLVIVDLFLKSGSGLSLLRRARRADDHRHWVVLSNYATTSVREQCTALGAERVFDKSGELDELFTYCVELERGTDSQQPGT